MSASVNEPFLLSSFELPKKASKSKRSSASSIYVSHDGSVKEGSATVAVHGDGVHVLDVSELHISNSYSLGPSTTFACSAVSRVVEEHGVSVRKTYAVIASSSEVKKEAENRTIWLWREPLEGSSARADDKQAVVLSHDIVQLVAPPTSEDMLLALSNRGDVTVLDADLAVRHTEPHSSSGSKLVKSFVFATSKCSFLPAGRPPSQITVILFLAADNGLMVLGYTVGEDIERVCEDELDVSTEDISDIAFSEPGLISVLHASRTIDTFQLQLSSPPPRTIRSLPSSIHLNESRLVADNASCSMLSLHSSLVLLAALTSDSAPSVAILLLDLTYSVVLAEHTMSIPSSHSSSSGYLLQLVAASPSQVLLSLSPKQSGSRAAVYAIPVIVPARSTLAGAMRATSLGANWLVQPADNAPESSSIGEAGQTMLKKVESALSQKRVPDAESAYAAYIKPQGATTPSNELLRRLVVANFQSGRPHAPKIVEDLLKRKLVSNSMVDGGLLPALEERKAFDLLQLALKTVIDIPESDFLAALRPVVVAHVKSSTGDDEMQVDGSLSPPALAPFLALVVAYPTSPAPLRLAIRRHLSAPENVVAVLEVLDGWLDQTFGSERPLFISEDKTKAVGDDLPPIEKIVAFLRTTLDASFLALLQYRPARALLQRLSSRLTPETELLDELTQLSAPLEAYVKADAARKAGPRKDVPTDHGDWRKRRKAAHERANMAVGLYQVEELHI
ncbi:hypothetical protein PENSPDRAFT_646585 [Peniophora sp. CONT]|nr:hypothetical protein PENSPDRAFT_646585 [Peniophora sp. CONT]